MDQPNPVVSAFQSTSSASASQSFPPIKELIVSSWQDLKKNLLLLFIYTTIGIFGILLLSGIFVGLISTFPSVPLNTTVLSIITLILSVGYLFGLFLFLNAMFAANILLLSDVKNPPFSGLVTFSIRKALPLLVIGLLTSLLSLGGYFLLVLPGLIFSMFFLFAPFAAVLENLSPVASLKRSIYLVSRYFGDIFIRLLVMLAIPLLVGFVLDNFSASASGALLAAVANLVFNLLFTWFSIAYLFTLYKQAKQRSDSQGQSRLRPIMLISIVGWVVGAFLIAAASYYSALPATFTELPAVQTVPTGTAGEFDELLLEDASASPSATPATSPSPRATTAATRSASPR